MCLKDLKSLSSTTYSFMCRVKIFAGRSQFAQSDFVCNFCLDAAQEAFEMWQAQASRPPSDRIHPRASHKHI